MTVYNAHTLELLAHSPLSLLLTLACVLAWAYTAAAFVSPKVRRIVLACGWVAVAVSLAIVHAEDAVFQPYDVCKYAEPWSVMWVAYLCMF